jgi:hypothetical protein
MLAIERKEVDGATSVIRSHQDRSGGLAQEQEDQSSYSMC